LLQKKYPEGEYAARRALKTDPVDTNTRHFLTARRKNISASLPSVMQYAIGM